MSRGTGVRSSRVLAGRPLNPVLARELKERMRRRRSAAVLTVYLVVLAAVVWLLYLGASLDESGPGALRLASLGRTSFHALLFTMLLLVCFIVPGLCSGGIAGERERQTLVPLQLTLLRPRSILLGKLAASLAFVAFLVLATLPLVGTSFFLGGVQMGDLIRGFAMVLIVAAVLGAISLTCSTLFKRTQGATVISYAVVLFLLVGTFFVFGAQLVLARRGPAGNNQAILFLNPLMATADVISTSNDDRELLPSPFTPLQLLIDQRRRSPDAAMSDPVQNPQSSFMLAPPQWRPPWVNRIPFWVESLACYLLVSVGCLVLASRRLSLPARGGGAS
ncbi:MAG: ABC transporter permease [Acidimicrobiia bacterium]